MAELTADGIFNGRKATLRVFDDRPAETIESRTAAMSSTLPKSESTTSLLKSSSARRPTHLPERAAESRRGQHHHQHHHQHRPAAAQSSDDAADESFWSAECDVSARRPLCHPTLPSTRDSHDVVADRGKSRSHAPHGEVPEPSAEEAGKGVRERCSSKHAHRHHRRKPHRDREDPPPAGPHEPEDPRRCRTHTRPVPEVPSLSDTNDDTTPLFEPRDRKGAGHVSSPSPSSCSVAPLSSRSSRRSRRSSAASTASDINLRTVLHSLFGQVRPRGKNTGETQVYCICVRCRGAPRNLVVPDGDTPPPQAQLQFIPIYITYSGMRNLLIYYMMLRAAIIPQWLFAS